MTPLRHLLYCLCALLFLATGCAINPVTGDRELSLVGEQQEIAIGSKQYEPGRQMQGGDYLCDPELTAYVKGVGASLAAVSDRKLPYEFTILNNSTPNAWALPGGKIVINRGLLLELQSEAELAAVLGHEIVHAAARHGAKSMERGMLLQGALLATAVAAGDSGYGGLAVGGAQVAAGLISQKYSRDAELEADYYGMLYMSRAGYDPRSAIDLQQTFVRLSEAKKPNWLAGLFASHPPSQERVDTNKETASQLPPGGELGKQTYQNKIKHLQKTAPAYKAFEEGSTALQSKDNQKALALAQKALEIEPREALFYGLEGDSFFQQHQYSKALKSYNQAIKHNNNFFKFYEQRGLTREKLGDRQGAKQDLAKSAKILPTATAYKELGDLSLADGNRDDAKKFYQAAATSQSTVGKEAFISLVGLDLTDNPQQYITLNTTRSKSGIIKLKVTNTTPLPIKGIIIMIRYVDARGRIQETPLRLADTLPAGQSLFVQLNDDPLPAKYLHNMEVHVAAARLAR